MLHHRYMISAMRGGRVVWGIAMCCFLGPGAEGVGFAAFMSEAFLDAIPDIILQLVFIPAVIFILAHLVPFRNHIKQKKSSI